MVEKKEARKWKAHMAAMVIADGVASGVYYRWQRRTIQVKTTELR
jgi:hypothetical protein